MPRKRRSKHLRPPRPLGVGHARAEHKRDGAWVVRDVAGTTAVKTYQCPGCSRTIAPGTPHIVAWPREPSLASASPVEERRHWHTGCWRRKL